MLRPAALLVVCCTLGPFLGVTGQSESITEQFRPLSSPFLTVQGSPAISSDNVNAFDQYGFLGLLESRSDRVFYPISITPPVEDKLRLSLFYFATAEASSGAELEVVVNTASAVVEAAPYDEIAFSIGLDRLSSGGSSTLFSNVSGLGTVLQNQWVELSIDYAIGGAATVFLNGFSVAVVAPPPQCVTECSVAGVTLGYALLPPTPAPTTAAPGPVPAPAPGPGPAPAPAWTHRIDLLYAGSQSIVPFTPFEATFHWEAEDISPGKAVRAPALPTDILRDADTGSVEYRVPVGGTMAFRAYELMPTAAEFNFRFAQPVTASAGRDQGLRLAVASVGGAPLLEIDVLSSSVLVNDPRGVSAAGTSEAKLRQVGKLRRYFDPLSTAPHSVRLVFDWEASTFDVVVDGVEVVTAASPITPGEMLAVERVTFGPTPTSSDAVLVASFSMGAACTTESFPLFNTPYGTPIDATDTGGLTCKGTTSGSECYYAWSGDGFAFNYPSCQDSYGVPSWSTSFRPSSCSRRPLSNFGFGSWRYACTHTGCEATLECSDGWSPAPGTVTRTTCSGVASSISEWSPMPKGKCQRNGIACDPFHVPHTVHDCDNKGAGDTCTYHCAEGFHFADFAPGDEFGGDPDFVGLKAQCDASGKWKEVSGNWIDPTWPVLACVPWYREPTAELPPYDASIRFGGVEPAPATEPPTTAPPTTGELLRASSGAPPPKELNDPIHLFRHRGSLVLDSDLRFQGASLLDTLQDLQNSMQEVEFRMSALTSRYL